MAANRVIYLTILFYAVFVTQSWTVYLPENRGESKTNQLDTIEEQQKQLVHDTATVRTQRHHQSYDKIDDVVIQAIEGNSDDDVDNTNTHSLSLRRHVADDASYSSASTSRKKRELSDWLIAPNTRWCGRGNTANGTYNHLGGASSADKCCRKHDHCQLYVPAMSNRYELFNYRPYTLSHCNCDRRFRTCLKMADDEDAQTIGKLFFNMVQTQCFILRKEKVCRKRAKDGSCEQEYVKQKAYLKNNRKF